MQFTSDNAKKVNSGQKTQTRRPVKEGDLLTWAGVPGESPLTVFSHPNDLYYRERWQEGKTYAIQPGRTQSAIGYATLKTIRKERLQDISGADAVSEGVTVYDSSDLKRFDDAIGGARIASVAIEKAAVFLFAELWDSIYGPGLRWEDNPEVWVLEFMPKSSLSEN